MVQKTNQNIELIRKFKKSIQKNIKIHKLILFGSRATRTFSRYSDFDVLVISKDFRGIPWYKRPVKLYLMWNEDYPIEILCYTPEEIKQKLDKVGIVSEAVKHGIEI